LRKDLIPDAAKWYFETNSFFGKGQKNGGLTFCLRTAKHQKNSQK
jgi:hypothetical protein